MSISYRTAINILQIIFFAPSLALSMLLCFAQAASTWRFIGALSALRTAGAICYFVALSYPSTGLYTSVIVCELVGIAPLMLTLVVLIGRVNEKSKTLPRLTPVFIGTFSLIGLILAIVGVTKELEDAPGFNSIKPNTYVIAAISLLLVCCGLTFIFGVLVTLDTAFDISKHRNLGADSRLLPTVGLAAPFVVVRMVYSALGAFSHGQKFNIVSGSNTAYLCMDVLMEIIAISICLSSAYYAPAVRSKKAEKGGDGHEGQTGRLKRRSLEDGSV